MFANLVVLYCSIRTSAKLDQIIVACVCSCSRGDYLYLRFFSPQLIVFLKGFTQEEREKLAIALGICLANGLGNPTCLQALFEDHLVKDGTQTNLVE